MTVTDTDHALEHLNRLRNHVDGDLAEYVDALARVVLLEQDVNHPMFGAKVQFHTTPDGEWLHVPFDYYRERVDNGGLLPDDPEEAWEIRTDPDATVHGRDDEPWYLRWRRLDGDNHKHAPDGEIEHRFERYFAHGEEQKVERSEVPDPLDPDNDIGADIELARDMEAAAGPGDEWFGEWMVYEADFREYRFTPYEPVTDFVSRRAIVVEPHVSGQPSGTEFWDPNRGEYTTPDDYPMGTVNLVVPDDPDEEFVEDYTYDMRVETSVVPADGNPGGHTYTPGWPEEDSG